MARESYFDDGVEEYGNGGRVKGEQGWGWDEGGTDGGGVEVWVCCHHNIRGVDDLENRTKT